MAKLKTPGAAVERRLTEDLKKYYPQFASEVPSIKFSKVSDPCAGKGYFTTPGAGLFRFAFEYSPYKAEHRLRVYQDTNDDSQA